MQLYNLRGQRQMPLRAAHVRALTDGRLFLANMDRLRRDLEVEPYCVPCVRLGQPAAVVVTLASETPIATFRCRHTAGEIRRDHVLETEPLLATLHWNLRCTACGEPVQAFNGKTDARFVLDCVCSTRALDNPLAPPSHVPPMAGVGRAESL